MMMMMMPGSNAAASTTATLLFLVTVAALVLRSAGQDYDFGDTGWDSGPKTERPCQDADCDVPSTTTSKTTRAAKTTKPPATRKSTKHPKNITTTTTTMATPRQGGHQYDCNPQETRKAACLNNGRCFVVYIGTSRKASCHCHDVWRGKRCEEADPDYYMLSAGVKAAIGIGVVGVVIIILVVVGVVFYKRRKNRKNMKNKNKSNESTKEPESYPLNKAETT